MVGRQKPTVYEIPSQKQFLQERAVNEGMNGFQAVVVQVQ